MAKSLLITGATGKQGKAVIDALLDADPTGSKFTILAVTRNAASDSAKRLAGRSKNIKIVQGDLDDVPALFESAKSANDGQPVWGVFSVQVSFGPGVSIDGEVRQGTDLIDGAVKAGVKHFVYSSVERGGDSASWEKPTTVPHFQSKQRIEQHLRAATATGEPGASMGWTVFRPVAFMDNLAPGFPTKVFLAALRNWLGDSNKPLQWVATDDIGVFVVKAFEAPDEWNHRAVGLAGDELTIEQLSRAFSKVTGSPAPITYWFFGSALTYAMKEMGLMIEWFASDGFKTDIEARRRDHPGLLTMEQWLEKKSGWAAENKQ